MFAQGKRKILKNQATNLYAPALGSAAFDGTCSFAVGMVVRFVLMVADTAQDARTRAITLNLLATLTPSQCILLTLLLYASI